MDTELGATKNNLIQLKGGVYILKKTIWQRPSDLLHLKYFLKQTMTFKLMWAQARKDIK